MTENCANCGQRRRGRVKACIFCGSIFPAGGGDAPAAAPSPIAPDAPAPAASPPPPADWVALVEPAAASPRVTPQAAPSAAPPQPPEIPAPQAPAITPAPEPEPAPAPFPQASPLAASAPAWVEDQPEVATSGSSGSSRWLWVGAPLVLLGMAGAAWWAFSDIRPNASVVSAADDGTVPADPTAWQASYADQYVGDGDVTMTTRASARRRNLPSTQSTQELGSLAAGTALSGRWVRGHDGQSRWLKLADGSYVWEGNLVEPGGPGSPIAIPFSNDDFSFGREISTYLDQARATAASRIARADTLPEKERLQRLDALETMSTFVRVPNRQYLGLTITGVGQHYEGSSIYFRDSVASVLAAFRANGLKVTDDGTIAGASDEPESCSINGSMTAEERAIGATALTCGV